MAHVEVTRNKSQYFGDRTISVKCQDEKWNNFPNTILYGHSVSKFENFKNFEVREDDIFIAGYPRSGTTISQELIWIIANDFNFEMALKHDCDARVAQFEHPEWTFQMRENRFAKSLEDMQSPRVFKTHLPVQLLPDEVWTKKPRIVYISRDVKDVAVSFYHLIGDTGITMDINEYFEEFLNDRVPFTPYRENRLNYLHLPDYNNILYLTYEGMSADLDGTIKNVAHFLGKTVSLDNSKKLKDHLMFDNMKNLDIFSNKKVLNVVRNKSKAEERPTNFIRKGVVGGHKNEMPEEYIKRFNDWFSESANLNQGFAYTEK